MSDSFWKKEISFGKKAKPDADAEPVAPEQPKQSFLKKEISFSRKPKADADPDAFELPKQSLMKKEISFSRKPKEPKRRRPNAPRSSRS
jgi:hypothetical protein